MSIHVEMPNNFSVIFDTEEYIPQKRKWNDLTVIEKKEFIAKLSHLVNASDDYFDAILYLVEESEAAGIFDKVKFNP